MKVKNIAFSGFAAAILSGVGAAQAVTVSQLVTPNYVDKAIEGKVSGVEERVTNLEDTVGDMITSKQDALTAGTGISIDNNTISADMSEATVSVGGQNVTVEAALAGKQDALENATVLENITANDLTAIGTIADKANASDVEDALALKADKSTTYTKTEVDNALALKANQSIIGDLGAAGTVAAYVDEKTKNVVNNSTLEQVQGDIDALEGLVGNTAVATQIADAVAVETNARVAADNAIDGRLDALETASATHALKSDIANMATTGYVTEQIQAIEHYDDTELSGRVTTLENAGYQNESQVNALIATGTSTLATKQSVTDLETAFESAYDKAVEDIATNTENIGKNATAIATNAEHIVVNAGAISALQANKMVVGPDGDGLWLAKKSGDIITWEQVEILDELPVAE